MFLTESLLIDSNTMCSGGRGGGGGVVVLRFTLSKFQIQHRVYQIETFSYKNLNICVLESVGLHDKESGKKF